jgi:hypothetical protein
MPSPSGECDGSWAKHDRIDLEHIQIDAVMPTKEICKMVRQLRWTVYIYQMVAVVTHGNWGEYTQDIHVFVTPQVPDKKLRSARHLTKEQHKMLDNKYIDVNELDDRKTYFITYEEFFKVNPDYFQENYPRDIHLAKTLEVRKDEFRKEAHEHFVQLKQKTAHRLQKTRFEVRCTTCPKWFYTTIYPVPRDIQCKKCMEATLKEQEKVKRQRQYMEAQRRQEEATRRWQEETRRQKMIQERKRQLFAMFPDAMFEDDASWRELRTKVHAMMA